MAGYRIYLEIATLHFIFTFETRCISGFRIAIWKQRTVLYILCNGVCIPV